MVVVPGTEGDFGVLEGHAPVRRLAGNPRQEPRDFGMFHQRLARPAGSREFGVGEMRVNRAVTDGMHRHGLAPALGLGHRVMPLNLAAEGALAEPARPHFIVGHRPALREN